jgi:hypothetical protein
MGPIFTVGHSTRPAEEFVALLQAHHAALFCSCLLAEYAPSPCSSDAEHRAGRIANNRISVTANTCMRARSCEYGDLPASAVSVKSSVKPPSPMKTAARACSRSW